MSGLRIGPQLIDGLSAGRSPPRRKRKGKEGPHWSEIADFEPLLTHSASAITHSEKSSIDANRKLTTRFLMSLR